MSSVEQFWEWFVRHEENLRADEPDHRYTELLGKQLRDLELPRWEIGPFDQSGSTHFLALSGANISETGLTNRNELLKLTPPPRWTLLALRPPKKWSRRFHWGSERVCIDANEWLFEVYKFEDGMFDLVLRSEIPEIADLEEKRDALVFALDSELGEAGMIEKINAVELGGTQNQPSASGWCRYRNSNKQSWVASGSGDQLRRG